MRQNSKIDLKSVSRFAHLEDDPETYRRWQSFHFRRKILCFFARLHCSQFSFSSLSFLLLTLQMTFFNHETPAKSVPSFLPIIFFLLQAPLHLHFPPPPTTPPPAPPSAPHHHQLSQLPPPPGRGILVRGKFLFSFRNTKLK